MLLTMRCRTSQNFICLAFLLTTISLCSFCSGHLQQESVSIASKTQTQPTAPRLALSPQRARLLDDVVRSSSGDRRSSSSTSSSSSGSTDDATDEKHVAVVKCLISIDTNVTSKLNKTKQEGGNHVAEALKENGVSYSTFRADQKKWEKIYEKQVNMARALEKKAPLQKGTATKWYGRLNDLLDKHLIQIVVQFQTDCVARQTKVRALLGSDSLSNASKAEIENNILKYSLFYVATNRGSGAGDNSSIFWYYNKSNKSTSFKLPTLPELIKRLKLGKELGAEAYKIWCDNSDSILAGTNKTYTRETTSFDTILSTNEVVAASAAAAKDGGDALGASGAGWDRLREERAGGYDLEEADRLLLADSGDTSDSDGSMSQVAAVADGAAAKKKAAAAAAAEAALANIDVSRYTMSQLMNMDEAGLRNFWSSFIDHSVAKRAEELETLKVWYMVASLSDLEIFAKEPDNIAESFTEDDAKVMVVKAGNTFFLSFLPPLFSLPLCLPPGTHTHTYNISHYP